MQRVYQNFISLLFCIYLFLVLGKNSLIWTVCDMALVYEGKKVIKAIFGKRIEKIGKVFW